MTKANPANPKITIIGLGPGDPGLITRRAWEIIQSADEIYFRTDQHLPRDVLPTQLKVVTFDDIYQEESAFNSVYQRITEKILQLSQRPNGVIYAVPGDPFVGEATTTMILAEASQLNIPVEIISGVSFLEPILAAVETDLLSHVTILDALDLQDMHFPPFPPDSIAIIGQIYSPEIASNLKLNLMAIFPDDHPVQLIHNAGLDNIKIESIPLYKIDRSRKIGLRTSLFVPPLEKGSSLESFQEVIAHLRAPDGCPWDREQDHQSLRINLLEETYEALEAIDANDPEAMREEFGDLLLQILLHAQIAREYGEFSMSDVIRSIYLKIIQRHPHIFEDLSLEEPGDVIKNWERIKAKERNAKDDKENGILNGVPGSLPALSQSQTYQKRAARVGFDWKDLDGVIKKIPEEIKELQDAQDHKEISAEVGDLLFSVVNIARWLGIDAESALREANQRFKDRFSDIEKEARASGRELSDLSLEELDKLWDESKSKSVD